MRNTPNMNGKFIATGIICFFAGLITGKSSQNTSYIPPTTILPQPITNSLNLGTDHYEVQFTGTPGAEFYGSYGVVYTSRSDIPPKTRLIQGKKLPYTVKFTLYKGAIVSVEGFTSSNKINAKILRNGTDCGVSLVEGSDSQSQMQCQ